MKTLKASWMTARAVTAWVTGRISETECRGRVNEARALIGKPPMAGS
jgi:hypothetical protein